MKFFTAHIWVLILTTLFMWLISLPGPVRAAGLYEVYEVTGDILIWHPLGSFWRPLVAGTRVEEGELVQMQTGSALSVRGLARGQTTVVANGFKLKADRPLITRVTPSALRQVQMSGYSFHVDGLEKKKEKEKKPPEPSLVSSAWKRALTFFTPKDAKPDLEIGTQLAARTGPGANNKALDDASQLTLDYPRQGSTLLVASLPTVIAASWRTPKNSQSKVDGYNVYVWREDRGDGALYGRTAENYLSIKIIDPGRYFVRVETLDGRWRSPVHLFIVSTL